MGLKRDLITLYEAAGVGTHNVNMFTTTRSSPPILASGAASLSIIETGGTGPERTNTTRISGSVQKVTSPAYQKPSAVIIVRAGTPAQAETMARAAYNACAGFRNGFINSGWYREIDVIGDLIDNGIDDRQQSRFTFNVIAIKRPN